MTGMLYEIVLLGGCAALCLATLFALAHRAEPDPTETPTPAALPQSVVDERAWMRLVLVVDLARNDIDADPNASVWARWEKELAR